MHVLFLPKWYPGRNDPQLGDFIRKQALAVAGLTKVSVLHVTPLNGLDVPLLEEIDDKEGLWELHCYYRPSTARLRPLRRWLNGLRYRKAMEHGWRRVVAERGRPDLMHVHILVRPALMASVWQRRHGIPYLVSEQSSEYLDGSFEAHGIVHRMLARRAMRGAAAVTAVSRWLGDALVRKDLCSSYAVVPNVIPGLERPLPPPGRPGDLLVVADLVDRTKNVSGVLRALAKAREQDTRPNLTIIGDGPDREALEALATSLGLGQVVRFLGRLANHEVLDHMARCWAVIVNSNVETFSVVTGEALAQGRPVIATRCGGPIAFVTPENGILIPVRDDASLTSAMLRSLRDHDRYDPAVIRQSVSELSGHDAVGRAFILQYRNILDHAAR